MSLDSQPRDDMGKYGYKPHTDPEIILAENVDGSFLFPPSAWPGGVEQYVEFWKTQPISDDALTTFVSSYAAEWDDWAIPLIKEHLHMWGNSREMQRVINRGVTASQLMQMKIDEKEKYEAELEKIRPARIPTALARSVARGAQLIHNLPSLATEQEREEASRAVLHTNKESQDWTAQEIWDHFQLKEIMPDAFYARENAVYRKLVTLNSEIFAHG